VVVAGGYQTGVVLMRNLVRRALDVHCVEWFPEQPCFRSVYGKSYRCPNPDEKPDEWLNFMIELSGKLASKPVLIPTADQFVTAIGTHAAELQKHYVFCHAGASVQALLATKQRQYDLAGEHGLPVPRTQFVSSVEEMSAFASSARFPCLFKPLHAREWGRLPAGHPFRGTQLVVAGSAEELLAKYRLVAEIIPALVVQEVIEGPDTAKLVYLSCYGVDGRRIGACMVREVRTTPIYFGSASVVEPVVDEEADSLSDGFLRSIGYAGICELELKRDSRDGRVKLIEANPRYSVTADAAPYAGVDLGWLHYLDLIGRPVATTHPHGRDFRHIVLLRDFATFRSYLRDGLATWSMLLRSYRRPVGFFDFDIRDWRVTAATVNQLIRLLIGPPLRRLFPRKTVS
jgi:predicted ATP-grasp superfamily ATP-dependent carboligase